MLANELLCEIHFTDLYPRGFTEFYTKYAPLANNPSLYVNFTNAVGNTIDKTFSPKPNHRDPSGLYTYPLEYITSHAANVEYGQQTRYLRVIRDTSQHKLVLNTLTQTQAVQLLTKMGVAEPDKRMAFVQRRYQYAGGNLYAKQFFGVLQTYLEIGQKMTTSNAMQTALLRKAGIDAVEDRAASTIEAIIFRDEPEQCIFLTRSAFQVIDVFELRSQAKLSVYSSDPREKLIRLPGLIAQAISDRIIGNNMAGERESAMTFYTAAKRKIVINMDQHYRFLDAHRGPTTFSKDAITVGLLGPGFAPIRQTYPPDTTFQEIASDIASKFQAAEQTTGKSYDRQTEIGTEIVAVNALVAKVCARLKVPFTPATNEATAYRVYRTVKMIGQMFGLAPLRKTDITTIEQTIPTLWRNDRQPQGGQLLALWQAASANRKVRSTSIRDLEKIANDLDIKAVAAKTGDIDVQPMGDITVFRRNNALMLRWQDKEQQIATINNLKLDAWKHPVFDHNHTLMLPHAKAFADYLNDHRYMTVGYVTYLPTFFGISYHDDQFMPFTEAAPQIDTIDDMPVYQISDSHGSWVVAQLTATQDHSDLGAGYAGVIETWPALETIVNINDDKQIVNIPSAIVRYMKNVDQKSNSSIESLYGGIAVGQAFADRLTKGHFDLKQFCRKHGFTPSAQLRGDEIALFGMKINKDNGKIGKTYPDIMNPIGEFGGTSVYTVVPESTWSSSDRYFFVKTGDSYKQILRCDRDSYDGTHNVKILAIGDDLTPEQRACVRAIAAHYKLSVPTKFRSKVK